MLRLSLMLTPGSAEDMLRFAHTAEAGGFHRLWASSFLNAAAVAPVCRRIEVATGVAIAFSRTPFETAQNSLELARYTNGRFVLGLGAGRQQAVEAWHGLSFAHPIARLREYTLLVRGLMGALANRTRLTHDGTFYRAHYAGSTREALDVAVPPIHLGVGGPLASHVAGQVADGILGNVVATPKWLEQITWPRIRSGLRKNGRDERAFEVTGTLVCAISRDRVQARADAARVIAYYAGQPRNMAHWALHGFDEHARRVLSAPTADAYTRIPDEMIDCFCAAGTDEEVRQAVTRFEGVANAVRLIPPPFVLDDNETATYQQSILATFGSGGESG
jgi:alkanesulfonate monooxygenase SsuD/methylene tetrahydromethanopterin reductase-like flavin-dependent oxidoreductase (luciferase family)